MQEIESSRWEGDAFCTSIQRSVGTAITLVAVYWRLVHSEYVAQVVLVPCDIVGCMSFHCNMCIGPSVQARNWLSLLLKCVCRGFCLSVENGSNLEKCNGWGWYPSNQAIVRLVIPEAYAVFVYSGIPMLLLQCHFTAVKYCRNCLVVSSSPIP